MTATVLFFALCFAPTVPTQPGVLPGEVPTDVTDTPKPTKPKEKPE